jgi:hypothetical protein
MKNVLYILLGWMLGLVSPWFAEVIQRPYKRSQVKRGVFVELRDLRAKLTSVVIRVGVNRGTLDTATLTWVRRITESDPESFRRFGDLSWETVSRYKDEDLKALSRASTPANQTLNFRRYSLPFLDVHLITLNLFPLEFRRIAHRIRANLTILNQEVDIGWFYFQKTFDSSLSELNRQLIRANHNSTHDFIEKISREIVDDIGLILEL